MADVKSKKATRHLALFWYVPVIIVLVMGTWVSLAKTALTGEIVQKARTFQDTQDASKSLEDLDSTGYNLSVALDEKFSIQGNGFKATGDFRNNQELEIPYEVQGEAGSALSSLRMELLAKDKTGLIPGFSVTVRECPSNWKPSASGYTCVGDNHIVHSTSPLTPDSFSVMKDGEQVNPKDTRHLLIQIDTTEELILPVKGYRTPLTVLLTGVRTPTE